MELWNCWVKDSSEDKAEQVIVRQVYLTIPEIVYLQCETHLSPCVELSKGDSKRFHRELWSYVDKIER